ncbi:hypothetical protein L2E82_45475 [Cichorium intybus]|uniref:Uncharacterized protein n=1 Tax=Cichorium intybus TaxID=13427 RepID=A0ACB8ZSZ6_CICIN|nr:hypothetical protein L2E82_45475 [Cichorium intybus]
MKRLSTLVLKDYPRRWANVLHDCGALVPILEVMNWGLESLKGGGFRGVGESVYVDGDGGLVWFGRESTSCLVDKSGSLIDPCSLIISNFFLDLKKVCEGNHV